MQRIIFQSGDGVAVIVPVGNFSIAELARKDVPAGAPYRIVNASDIPTDRSERDFWTADFSTPDGHGIGAEAWFAEQGDRP